MSVNLLAIVGQTASGKSALALQIAQKLPAEIIAADSKTIYKGLDIGTAKPLPAEQKLIKHHLLDLVAPNVAFNVVQFQALARRALAEIRARAKLPILVGGSGLYIDSILLDYEFAASEGRKLEWHYWDGLSIEDLQTEIKRRHLKMPQNFLNRRYLVRTLERGQAVFSRNANGWSEDILVIGLKLERADLEIRIRQRLESMLTAGLLDEARGVFDNVMPQSEAAKSTTYAALWPYFEGRINLEEALEDCVKRDLALAKKQLTWFKRHQQVRWFANSREAESYICQKLAC